MNMLQLDNLKNNEELHAYLRAQGYGGTICDMVFAYLVFLGYGGALEDKIKNYCKDQSTTTTTTDFVMQVTIPSDSFAFTVVCIDSGVYDGAIDWGDGTTTTITTFDDSDLSHTYATAGDYEIRLSGAFPRLYLNGMLTAERNTITSIDNMGFLGLVSGSSIFRDLDFCTNLTFGNTDQSANGSLFRLFLNTSAAMTVDMTNVSFDICNSTREAFQAANVTSFDASGASMPNLNTTRDMFVGSTTSYLRIADLLNSSNFAIGMFRTFNNVALDDTDLDQVDPDNLGTLTDMFAGSTSMPPAEYDKILNAWAASAPAAKVFTNPFTYTEAGADARDTLINTYGWTITDGGLEL